MDEELQRLNTFLSDNTFKDYIIHMILSSFQRVLTITITNLNVSLGVWIESAYKELRAEESVVEALHSARSTRNIRLCRLIAEVVRSSITAIEKNAVNAIKIYILFSEIADVVEVLDEARSDLRTSAESFSSTANVFESNDSYSEFKCQGSREWEYRENMQNSEHIFNTPDETVMDGRLLMESVVSINKQPLIDFESIPSTSFCTGLPRPNSFFRPPHESDDDDMIVEVHSDPIQKERYICYEGKGKSIPSHLQYRKKFSWTVQDEKVKSPCDESSAGDVKVLGEMSKTSISHQIRHRSEDGEISVTFEDDLSKENSKSSLIEKAKRDGDDESVSENLQHLKKISILRPVKEEKFQQEGDGCEEIAKGRKTVLVEKLGSKDYRLPTILEDDEISSTSEVEVKPQDKGKDESVNLRSQHKKKVSWSDPLEIDNIRREGVSLEGDTELSSIISSKKTNRDSTDTTKFTPSLSQRSPTKVNPSPEYSVKISTKKCPKEVKSAEKRDSEKVQGSLARKRQFVETSGGKTKDDTDDAEMQGDDSSECEEISLSKKHCPSKSVESEEKNEDEKRQEKKFAEDDSGKLIRKRRALDISTFHEVSDDKKSDEGITEMIPSKEDQESSDKKRRVSHTQSLESQQDDASDITCKLMDSMKENPDETCSQKTEGDLVETELEPRDSTQSE